MASPSAAPDDDGRSWSAADTARFVAATAARPPRPLLVQALSLLPEGPPGRLAIDLGCGAGTESLELLRRGWRVLATDAFAEAIESVRRRAETEGVAERLAAERVDFEAIAGGALPIEPSGAALVHAGFSLPFCPAAHFPALWSWVERALAPQGLFAGQLFGPAEPIVLDAPAGSATSHSVDAVKALLETFDTLHFEEVDRAGHNAYGEPKHWHVMHVVARKRG
jgi:SAM-dependent methyltransferase